MRALEGRRNSIGIAANPCLLLAGSDFAAGGDVEGLTVALSSCVAG
jgi:hypothetical protein